MGINNIKIKGYANGLIVEYNGLMTINEVYDITAKKFAASRKFLGNSTACIVFRGIDLADEEESKLCDIIMDNSDLDIACVYHEFETQIFDDCLHVVADLRDKETIYFAKDDIPSDKVIKSANDIVIIGEVKKDACVISDKSIYIIGGLYGEAFAGKKDPNACIYASDMNPQSLKIGKYSMNSFYTHKKTLFKKNDTQEMIAHVENEKIVLSPFSNELIKEFRP